MEDILKQFGSSLLMLGVSIVGSSVQGAIIKHKIKRVDNDRIPVHTGTTWGGIGVAGAKMTGDPLVAVAGFAGATIASLGQKAVIKIFGKTSS